MERLSELVKVVQGIAPDADALAGAVSSDAVNMENFDRARFVLSRGAGTTGTQVLTVEACTLADGTGAEAIAYTYRRIDVSGSPEDTMGDFTAATASGITTEAGGDDIYLIEVRSNALPEAKPFLRLTSTEGVDAAVDAGCLIMLGGGRYGTDVSAVS